MEGICRACLRSSSNILKFDMYMTKIHKVFQCFENLTSIELKPNEIDSKICSNCFLELKRAFQFQQQCRENNQRYQELVGLEANPLIPNGLELVIIKQEELDGALTEESQIFEVQEVKTEDYSIGDSESNKIHIRANQTQTLPKSRTLFKYKVKKLKNYCDQFYQGTRAVYLRKKHEKEAHPKEFFQDCDEPHIECRYCGKIYEGSSRGRKAYLLHERKIHPNKTVWTEEQRKAERQDGFRGKISRIRNEKEYICHYCGVSCKIKGNLKLHMKRHLPKPPIENFDKFTCHFCTNVYRGQKAEYLRNKHEKEMHTEDFFLKNQNESFSVCQYCGKIYEGTSRGRKACLLHEQRIHPDKIVWTKEEMEAEKRLGFRGKSSQIEEEKDFICDYCGRRVKRKGNFTTHILRHLKESPARIQSEAGKGFVCGICGISCSIKGNLKKHMKRHLPKPSKESFEKFSCHFCSKIYRGQKAEYLRDQHEKTNHAEEFRERTNESFIACQYCGKIYEESTRGRTAYLQHIQRMHPDKIESRSLEDLEKTKDTGKSGAECDKCGKIFLNFGRLKVHMDRHLGVRNSVCEICGSKFLSEASLKAHLVQTHQAEEGRYNCTICGKKFFLNSNFKDHMDAHKRKKRYQCEKCSSSFRLRISLENHLLTHGNSLDFECSTCHRKFQNNNNLQSHIKLVHTKVQFVQCPLCPLKVKRRYFASHKKTHTDADTIFSCEYCSFYSKNKTRLTFHTIRKHLHSTFPCKLCGDDLPIKRGFQKTYINHVKEEHKELTKEEFDFFAYEISKLRAKNLCKDLPASILTPGSKYTAICDICDMNLFTVKGLEKHKETVHGIENLNSENQ